MSTPRYLVRLGSLLVLPGCLAGVLFTSAQGAAGPSSPTDLAADLRTRPAGASADSAAVDSAVIPAPAVTAAPPTAAELAALRARVDRHVARVHIGQDVYDVRGARFDPDGVAFDPGRLRASSPVSHDGRPPLPSSPLAWDRIDRVTVRKPCGQRGAVMGGLIGTGAMIAIAAYWNAAYHGDLTAGAAVIFTLPPIGALIGGVIGANTLRTEPGWKRAVGAVVEPGGPVVPVADSTSGATVSPPVIPIGVLRDEIGRRPVRLWVGLERYEVRDVRLGPTGIAFDAGELKTLSSRPPAAGRDGTNRPSPPRSPIGWDRIDRVEVRVPSATRGATWGMVLAAALLAGTVAGDTGSGSVGGAILVGAPIGAVVGAGVGAFVPHSKLAWERSASVPAAP